MIISNNTFCATFNFNILYFKDTFQVRIWKCPFVMVKKIKLEVRKMNNTALGAGAEKAQEIILDKIRNACYTKCKERHAMRI